MVTDVSAMPVMAKGTNSVISKRTGIISPSVRNTFSAVSSLPVNTKVKKVVNAIILMERKKGDKMAALAMFVDITLALSQLKRTTTLKLAIYNQWFYLSKVILWSYLWGTTNL